MKALTPLFNYDDVLGRIVGLLKSARPASARSVNTIMTSTYWEVGRQIVRGRARGFDPAAEYSERLAERLAHDLTDRFGRGFGRANLRSMRRFHLLWPPATIRQTLSGESANFCDVSTYDVPAEFVQTPPAPSPGVEDAVEPENPGELAEQVRGGIRQTVTAEFVNPFIPSSYDSKSGITQTASARFPAKWLPNTPAQTSLSARKKSSNNKPAF